MAHSHRYACVHTCTNTPTRPCGPCDARTPACNRTARAQSAHPHARTQLQRPHCSVRARNHVCEPHKHTRGRGCAGIRTCAHTHTPNARESTFPEHTHMSQQTHIHTNTYTYTKHRKYARETQAHEQRTRERNVWTNRGNKGLVSADRGNKPTLPLTTPRSRKVVCRGFAPPGLAPLCALQRRGARVCAPKRRFAASMAHRPHCGAGAYARQRDSGGAGRRSPAWILT